MLLQSSHIAVTGLIFLVQAALGLGGRVVEGSKEEGGGSLHILRPFFLVAHAEHGRQKKNKTKKEEEALVKKESNISDLLRLEYLNIHCQLYSY